MSDESAESAEAREAINATLKDALRDEYWGGRDWERLIKSLRDEYGIETDLLGLTQNAPGIVRILQIGAFSRKGIIKPETLEKLRQIISNLVSIAVRADEGEEKEANQLKAIHKLAMPKNYELPETVIKNLADTYYLSPHLQRAWAIRQLMFDLSFVVEPTSEDRSVLDGPVRLTTKNVHLHNPETYAQAVRHIKRNSTLQSLAIDVYAEALGAEGIFFEAAELKRDLRKLKEWEAANLTDQTRYMRLWSEPPYRPASLPPIPIYIENWKSRWRKGGKKSEKLQ